nr:hypothetical protein [uncultured Rhodopila sp.]
MDFVVHVILQQLVTLRDQRVLTAELPRQMHKLRHRKVLKDHRLMAQNPGRASGISPPVRQVPILVADDLRRLIELQILHGQYHLGSCRQSVIV